MLYFSFTLAFTCRTLKIKEGLDNKKYLSYWFWFVQVRKGKLKSICYPCQRLYNVLGTFNRSRILPTKKSVISATDFG